MPPKKRKAAAADTEEEERNVFYLYDDDVFVLTSESVLNEARDTDIKVYGVFTKWLDLKAKVLEVMEQDPVALHGSLSLCDEIEKEICRDLEEECEAPPAGEGPRDGDAAPELRRDGGHDPEPLRRLPRGPLLF